VAKTVAVDFDNTIHPYTRGWIGTEPDDEPAIDNAGEFLHALIKRGYHVVIHTTRAETQDGMHGVIRWLHKHLPAIFYEMRDQKTVSISAEKPKAIAYVDDRAVVFRGNFTDCLTEIEHLDLYGPVGGHRENR
jgi:hypothetical protein